MRCKFLRLTEKLTFANSVLFRKFRTISQIVSSKIHSNEYLLYHVIKTDFFFQKDVMWHKRVQPKKRVQPATLPATTIDEGLQPTVPIILPR